MSLTEINILQLRNELRFENLKIVKFDGSVDGRRGDSFLSSDIWTYDPNSIIYFENCEFHIPVQFSDRKFGNDVFFYGCKFFEFSSFNGFFYSICFENSQFFKGSTFDIKVDNLFRIRKTTFHKKTIFYPNKYSVKKFEFISNPTKEKSYFRHINFGNDVLFYNTDLTKFSFLFSNIEYVRFISCNFEYNNFVDEVDLVKKIEEDPSFSYNDLISLYRQFEINFDKHKNYDQAGEFHKKRFELDRKNQEKLSVRWLLLTFYKWSSNYGEDYRKSLIWIVIMILLFSLIYPFTGISYDGYHIFWWDCLKPYLFTDWGSGLLYSLISSSPIKRDSEIVKSLGGWTTALSIIQTIIQTILGTLFIIGIRRKFKR